MAYYTGKEHEKARGDAMKEVYLEHHTISEVARRFGVARSTIYRWTKKWQSQQIVELKNYGRPNREPGQVFRWQAVKWHIKTISSAPKTHPNALSSNIVQQVMKERRKNFLKNILPSNLSISLIYFFDRSYQISRIFKQQRYNQR